MRHWRTGFTLAEKFRREKSGFKFRDVISPLKEIP